MLDIGSGMRDINNLPTNTDEEEREFYWDVILLTEGQLLLPVQPNLSKQHMKKFQKYIVKRIGLSLNQIVKQPKLSEKCGEYWRAVGSRYYMVYLPLHFSDIIWCKSSTVYFHVFLPVSHNKYDEKRLGNEREWLLALLELASSFNLQFMKLYIRRNDLGEVSTFLRNLNWIGGKLVPNEDRNHYILDSPSDDQSLSDMLFCDENFVILEFEC